VERSEELLVEVRRGDYVESTHRVTACVVRADGEVLRSFGDADRTYPIRSLAKPFVAVELVRSGACEAYGLGAVELALASGSHDGSPDHVSAIRCFLKKIDVPEDALLCGPAQEGSIIAGPPVRNNCSGKHAAVLALCRRHHFSIANYTSPDHPVQQTLLPKLLSRFNRDNNATPLAIDGCCMPIFGATLREVASAYAAIGASTDHADHRVLGAIASEPAFYGGWGHNTDTEVVSWSNGTVIGKIGAEGLHADSLIQNGLGVAIKVQDGNSRAIPPVLAALIATFDDSAISSIHLNTMRRGAIVNSRGVSTGVVVLRADDNVDKLQR